MSERTFYRILWIVCLVVAVFLVLGPLYVMFKYSISDRNSWITGGEYPVPWWPFSPNFDMYRHYLGDRRFLDCGLLSLQIAFITVGISLFFGAPAAYGLARLRLNSKAVFLFSILAIRFFPDVASAIPVARLFNDTFLYDLPTPLKLGLAHSIIGLPYVVFIAQGVFESIPVDLEEQAFILGAGKMRTFLRIILPLALPGLAAGAIYIFLLSWNEFVFSYFITATSPISVTPLPIYLKVLMGSFSPNLVSVSTLSFLVSLPVIVFTFAVQKYMVAGMTAGAVK